MRAELETTPKPGLVDLRDCGAHDDMNPVLFRASIDAIEPLLHRMAREARGRLPSPGLFEELRGIGREAEQAMFSATCGINTHKGQIFVLTLLIAAVCSARDRSAGGMQEAVRRMTAGMVERELLDALRSRLPVSHGEHLYLRFGAAGVRGEAEAGFPSIFRVGLPVYRRLLRTGLSRNDAAAQTLLHIMCGVEDTTVLHRGGREALAFVRRRSRQALSLGGVRTAQGRRYLDRMNRAFIRRGISPGGAADLLAGTLFIHRAISGGRIHG